MLNAVDVALNNGKVEVGGDIGNTVFVPRVVSIAGCTLSATPGTPSSSNFLRGDGTWAVPSLGGSAGGDLSGTYPNPTVAKVNGVSITGTPSANKVPVASSGTAASWAAAPASPPNGSAGGDLSGTYPNPTVAGINGVSITGTPAAGNVPIATSGTAAVWGAPSGGGGVPVPFSATPTWRAPWSQSNATNTPNTGNMVLWPMRLDAAHTLTGLACLVTTAATTGTVQVVVYADNGSWMPGTQVTATSALSMTSTGVVSATFTGVSLPAGWYWIGILPVFTGTPQFEESQLASNSNLSDQWSGMGYGTGSAPTVTTGTDSITAAQGSLATAPGTFAGSYTTNHAGGGLRYWIAMQLV
jgi:hypothetical protein